MSFTYTSSGTTSLAGYKDSTKALGMDLRTMAPGWGFVLGRQPDTSTINSFAKKGYFTHDPTLNNLNRQDYNQHLSLTAQLIPLRDFLAVLVWLVSFAGHKITWRGEAFTLKNGKLAGIPVS